MYAKLQIGTTHEVGSVPHLPVYHKLAQKFLNQAKQRVVGAMECWNFGTCFRPTRNWRTGSHGPRSLRASTAISCGSLGATSVGVPPRTSSGPGACSPVQPTTTRSASRCCTGAAALRPAFPLYFRKVNRHMPIPWLLPAEIKYDTDFSWMRYTQFGDEIANYLDPSHPKNSSPVSTTS